MIRFASPWLMNFFGAFGVHPVAISFFVFIIYRDAEGATNVSLTNHEFIHFLQQLELLFVFHWLLYVFFYLARRAIGQSHHEAYRNNPFEKEAYANENFYTYILKRKPYAWLKYIK